MGVLAPVSAHAGPSAQPPIGTSGNFLAHVSAESPSNASPNLSEVISEVSELYDKPFLDIFDFSQFSGQNRVNWGGSGAPRFFFLLESSSLCYLGAHAKICNPMLSLSGIYLKLAHFPVKIGLIGGVGGVPKFFYIGILSFMLLGRPRKNLKSYDTPFLGFEQRY